MKIIQNTLKTEKKSKMSQKKFRVGPKKVGSVGFPEMRQFFFFGLVYDDLKQAKFLLVSLHINSRTFLSKICVHISRQDRNNAKQLLYP